MNMFVKLDMMVGVQTMVATSARVMPGEWHESRDLPTLVRETGRNFLMGSVAADPGYTSKRNLHVVVDEMHAEPYFKFAVTHGGNSRDELWNASFKKYAGRGKDWDDRYGMRAKSEASFSAFKRVLGESVRATSYNGQVAEVLLRVLAYNIRRLVYANYELGVDIDFLSPPTVQSSVLQ